ncbi:hypothetical protein E2C01_027100 [Portunus trituberculatus]|uniref:Uncharacterized protein n=1 Tax=Portunus trituberculatus TaxID=210409 RepID=A0A5B7EKR6_PORTR|nr:hypothetical protein [Portunus trituberculatus]
MLGILRGLYKGLIHPCMEYSSHAPPLTTQVEPFVTWLGDRTRGGRNSGAGLELRGTAASTAVLTTTLRDDHDMTKTTCASPLRCCSSFSFPSLF